MGLLEMRCIFALGGVRLLENSMKDVTALD
jgi:hypothetical protein